MTRTTLTIGDQLCADAHIARLRQLTRKDRAPVLRQVLAAWFAMAPLVVLAFVAGALAMPGLMSATSCASEDSARARIGTDAFGCVWWAGVQGNGEGRTVWNLPNR